METGHNFFQLLFSAPLACSEVPAINNFPSHFSRSLWGRRQKQRYCKRAKMSKPFFFHSSDLKQCSFYTGSEKTRRGHAASTTSNTHFNWLFTQRKKKRKENMRVILTISNVIFFINSTQLQRFPNFKIILKAFHFIFLIGYFQKEIHIFYYSKSSSWLSY